MRCLMLALTLTLAFGKLTYAQQSIEPKTLASLIADGYEMKATIFAGTLLVQKQRYAFVCFLEVSQQAPSKFDWVRGLSRSQCAPIADYK